MTRIWSGRLQDQVYAGMAERLVRQSNNARLSPNVGVNPRVRRILARMHRAGLLENMAGLWLPDMYSVDGDNRVEVMGGLTAQGALEQDTPGGRPKLTRDDERSNHILQSILPGTLGTAPPSGWSQNTGTDSGGSILNNQLVESDDPSGGHQALRTNLDNARVRIFQNVPVLSGQQLVIACFMESDGYVSGGDRFVVATSNNSLIDSNIEVDGTRSSQWLWSARDATGDGNMQARFGIGAAGNTNYATGDFRFSRPCVMYRPQEFLSWTESERQQWFSDHYAATSSLREYAGTPDGLRGIHFDGGDDSIGGGFNYDLSAMEEISLFALVNLHNFPPSSTLRRFFGFEGSDGGPWLYVRGPNDFAAIVAAGEFVNGVVASSQNQWRLVSLSAKRDGELRLYVDGVSVASKSLPDEPPSPRASASMILNRPSEPVNFTGGSCGFSAEEFSAEQHAALHEILTEAP